MDGRVVLNLPGRLDGRMVCRKNWKCALGSFGHLEKSAKVITQLSHNIHIVRRPVVTELTVGNLGILY